MPQAENVVSFPVNAGTTDLLRDFIAGPQERLDEIGYRLLALEALVGLARRADELPQEVSAAFAAIELAVHDCRAIADLRPAGIAS